MTWNKRAPEENIEPGSREQTNMFRPRGPHAQVYGYVHKGRAYVPIKTDTHTCKAMFPYVRLMETHVDFGYDPTNPWGIFSSTLLQDTLKNTVTKQRSINHQAGAIERSRRTPSLPIPVFLFFPWGTWSETIICSLSPHPSHRLSLDLLFS